MFCCDDKNRMSCYKGMAVGMAIAFTSMICFKIYKKINNKKEQKNIQQFEIKEDIDNKKYDDNQKIKLKEKIDEFNSRRLTKENELKNN